MGGPPEQPPDYKQTPFIVELALLPQLQFDISARVVKFANIIKHMALLLYCRASTMFTKQCRPDFQVAQEYGARPLWTTMDNNGCAA